MDLPTTSSGKPQAKSSSASCDNEGRKKVSVTINDPLIGCREMQDLQRSGYTVVKIEEKDSSLRKAIPIMPLQVAILCCILNIGAPGVGTLISSFCVFCCGHTRIDTTAKAFGLNLLSAFLQMLTFLVIVGWIWSILWGMTFVQLSLSSKDSTMPAPIPYYVRRQSSVE